MIEIMCRDGKVSKKDMEMFAEMMYRSTGIETNVIDEEDRRAMVFWGPSDVEDAAAGLNFSTLDFENMALCNQILEQAEPKIHKAMLEAGRDTLFDEICDYAESVGEDLNVVFEQE